MTFAFLVKSNVHCMYEVFHMIFTVHRCFGELTPEVGVGLEAPRDRTGSDLQGLLREM